MKLKKVYQVCNKHNYYDFKCKQDCEGNSKICNREFYLIPAEGTLVVPSEHYKNIEVWIPAKKEKK